MRVRGSELARRIRYARDGRQGGRARIGRAVAEFLSESPAEARSIEKAEAVGDAIDSVEICGSDSCA